MLNHLVMGGYLVVMPWIAISRGTVASVGQMFLLSSLLTLCLAPLFGLLGDRMDRCSILCIGQIFKIFGPVSIGLLFWALPEEKGKWLILFVIFTSIGLAIDGGTLDGIFQHLVSTHERVRRNLQCGLLRQVSLCAGATFAGWAIHTLRAEVLFFVFAALGILQTFVFPRTDYFPIYSDKEWPHPHLHFTETLQWIQRNKNIWRPSILLWTAFLCAQLVNLILPSFVKDHIGGDSRIFGILEGAWAVGGILFLLIPSFNLRWSGNRLIETCALFLMGMGILLLAFTHNSIFAIGIVGCVGGCFSILRGVSYGRILEKTPTENIGRVQGLLSAFTSFIAIAIYTLPSLVDLSDVRIICIAWGGLLFILGFGLGFEELSSVSRWHKKPRALTLSDIKTKQLTD